MIKPELEFKWKRFWCPRSAQMNLCDHGYLIDPDSPSGQYYNPDLVSLEAMADIPCLILLGEPGIGKSQEIENLRIITENKINITHKVFELNLRSCTSLKDDLFQDEVFINWQSSTHRLYLFLDSLDEGLLNIRTLATGLVDEFKKKKYRDKLSRLYLRIACRTAVFPDVLEELEELWTQENFKIYELAPLRRVDAKMAVTSRGLNPAAFLEEVDRKGIVPFASKPISLKFLIDIFQRNNGQLIVHQQLADIYLDGCRLLSEDPRCQNYHPQRQPNTLEVEQRLIIAARIAAITVFADRLAVWTGDLIGIPDKDIHFLKICLGTETANGREFPVTENAIREVLDTGLFSSRGRNRMGWAHQTYAEFLAAWYLKQHGLNLAQVLDLIFHSDRRVVPQSQETAAWLASMISEVFDDLVKTDPDVLPQSNIATATDIEKETVIKSLFQAYDRKRLFYSYRNIIEAENFWSRKTRE